jgi:hypothetical protein
VNREQNSYMAVGIAGKYDIYVCFMIMPTDRDVLRKEVTIL